MPDALARLLWALGDALPAEVDARTLADALWLAASGSVDEDAPPTHTAPAEQSDPASEVDPVARSRGLAPSEARTGPRDAESRQVSVRSPGATTMVRGVPLTLGRGSPLPEALAIGRAVQPFRQPWRKGGRRRLDIDATVEHYARGGPLVPLFRPAPEPWFEAVVLVDTSLSMSVWEETTRAVTGLLRSLGGFRTVHTWSLTWREGEPQVRDHHDRPVPGERVPHHGSGPQGRRLVLLVSDCAARGWHTAGPWLLLRNWGGQIPVALLDPLPPRLWRRSALNFPVVRVTGGHAGDQNRGLRYHLPPRLKPTAHAEDRLGPWAALPVVSATPRSLGAWASTLMRADPRGCDAVLIPATGRVPQTRTGTAAARRPDSQHLAEAFVHTAPRPAVRLAVLASCLPELPLPLLHVLRDQAVPEARYSDLAEVLTSGLFTVRPETDGDPVLVFHPAAQEHLRGHLTTHDVWQIERAFSRHVAAHPYAPQGIAAVLHDPAVIGELPAAVRPFAKAVRAARRMLEPAHVAGDSGDPGAAEATNPVRSLVRLRMLAHLDPDTEEVVRRDAEVLLDHLIGYVASRLPAPLGHWPTEDTYFDEVCARKGSAGVGDVVPDLVRYFTGLGIALERRSLPEHAAGPDLLWQASGGPVIVRVRKTPFSWDSVTAGVRAEPAAGARACSPVEFVVVLDQSEKPGGLHPLDDCVAVTESTSDRRRVSVVLRVQTRHGRGSRESRADLANALRVLRSRAGSPSHDEVARHALQASPPVQLDPTTLARWFAGREVPAEERGFIWLTRFLRRRAGLEDGGDLSHSLFTLLLSNALQEERRRNPVPVAASPRPRAVGVPVAHVQDPTTPRFVPRSVDSEDETALLSLGPPYIERDHDARLRSIVREAADGTSGLVMLVGSAGSGKSRSCFEALFILPPDWRVWLPASSEHLEAVLRTPAEIGPRTVIWLDDAERCLLDLTDARGERVAEGLLALLRDPARSPVLILGTLSHTYSHVLGSVPPADTPDPHRQARKLIDQGTRIVTSSRLSRSEMARARAAADLNLADAVQRARDAEVIPYLAGRAAQIERYGAAPPAAFALVQAAADALRCGHGPELPRALLAAAVPGYLSVDRRNGLDRNWMSSALDYLTQDPPGAGSLLTRVRPEPGKAVAPASPCYRLSHHIARFARAAHDNDAPPDDLWDALAAHASIPDLEAVARTAEAQGDDGRAERFRGLAQRARDKARADAEFVGFQREEAHDEQSENTARTMRSLLQRTDLTPTEVRAAVDSGLDWLQTDGRTDSAQFVLSALLEREDLSADNAAESVRVALDWLAVRGDTPDAQFVLGRLLERNDLGEPAAKRTLVYALNWLAALGDTQWAQYVLRPVLLREDLSRRQVALAVDAALGWLERHGRTSTSQFVLSAALRRKDLLPGPRTRFVDAAIDWIRRADNSDPAKYVLRPLLQRTDLTPEEARAARDLGLHWLRSHGRGHSAQFVLNAVLYRRDLTPSEAREAAEHALQWLHTHGGDRSARYVLRPLTWRTDLSADLMAQVEELRARGDQDGGLILVADIEGFAKDYSRADARRRMYAVFERVLQDVDPPARTRDRGDGVVVFLPGQAADTTLGVDLVSQLRAELDDLDWNTPLRLRIALHRGDVQETLDGFEGRALVTANRLVDSLALRSALRSAVDSPLAVIVSDGVYKGLRHAPRDVHSAFRAVHVRTKEQVLRAWVLVPGYAQPPGVEEWAWRVADDPAE
ncbi:SAV_2336 N-terminal domain-related protein [Streptomyces sp. NPDC101165]|uniref:SAV_2336 N-terminal domain-related protein n=1 Tax=Streptomyces sp. NPDC101165 TaxID=3366119 RepID=UPI00382CE045